MSLTGRPRRRTVAASASPKSYPQYGTHLPLRRNDPSFREWVSRRTNLSLGVNHETPQHLDFDSMCVLRARGIGPATIGQVLQQLGRVSQVQHVALEPV